MRVEHDKDKHGNMVILTKCNTFFSDIAKVEWCVSINYKDCSPYSLDILTVYNGDSIIEAFIVYYRYLNQ